MNALYSTSVISYVPIEYAVSSTACSGCASSSPPPIVKVPAGIVTTRAMMDAAVGTDGDCARTRAGAAMALKKRTDARILRIRYTSTILPGFMRLSGSSARVDGAHDVERFAVLGNRIVTSIVTLSVNWSWPDV